VCGKHRERARALVIFMYGTCCCGLQGGGRLEYVTVSPSGEVRKTVLGSNLLAGDTMQFLCPGGGYMKGCRLLDGAGQLLLCF
jgi:predicted cupin superfamily sugar epimerase